MADEPSAAGDRGGSTNGEAAGSTVCGSAAPTDDGPPIRVLLLVVDRADRGLLREWLADTDGFASLTPGGGADRPATDRPVADATTDVDPFAATPTFDVCLLDVGGVRAYGDALAASREASDTYRPTLLFVPERHGDPEAALCGLGAAGAYVDETVAAPVRRATLARRLRTLARARRYSTELAASRNCFRRLVEGLPDATFVCADGAVAYANPRAGSLLAVPAGTLAGTPLVEFVPDDEREAVAALLADVAATGRAGSVETALVRATDRESDGGTDAGAADAGTADAAGDGIRTPAAGSVPVELTAVPLGDAEVQVLARDLRERVAREERLALYRRAMDAATVGITIADHTRDDEPLIYVNEEFERLTGRDAEELLGRNARVLQADATDPEEVAAVRAAIDAGEEASAVLLNRRADGRTWYNELTISPIRDERGEVTHYLGFQRDVTERVAHEQQIAVLDRVLRHNIRNRLNVVLGYAEAVAEAVGDGPPSGDQPPSDVRPPSGDRPPNGSRVPNGDRPSNGDGSSDGEGSPEEGAGEDGEPVDPAAARALPSGTDDASAVLAAVARIRAAATDLLELADSARRFRDDVAAPGADASPADASTLLADVVSGLARSLPDAEVRLSLPSEPVYVAGAAPLGLVADELVTNALRHAAAPTVSVTLEGRDGDAVLRVADDGPGITPDSRGPLEGAAETPTEHGQGVGLWLVRWTVEGVGGTVRYEEGPDGGAAVVVRFPGVDPPDDGG